MTVKLADIDFPLGWSLNANTGILTFDDPPPNAAVIKCSFQFDVPVRFDTDDLGISLQFVIPQETDSYSSVPSINLVEVRT